MERCYYFECFNALLTDKFWPESAFKSADEAVTMAANYEATLCRLTMENDKTAEIEVLYKPDEICMGCKHFNVCGDPEREEYCKNWEVMP